MKKLLSLIALVALLAALPVVLWTFKQEKLQSALIFNNQADSSSASGAEYFFNYTKANPEVTTTEDAHYSIGEAKHFDNAYLSTSDGYTINNEGWNQVKMIIDRNDPSLLFAEYGTIHNASNGDLANLISQDLGVHSTNWSGLFVKDLAHLDDVPQKVLDNIQGTYSGPGIIFNNSNENKTVVVELNSDSLPLKATDYGHEMGFTDLKTTYEGWFDVVKPAEGTQSVLDFSFDAKDHNLLDNNGIPSSIPAVTHWRTGASDRFYLAGRFSQAEVVPEVFQIQGIQRIYGAIGRYSSSTFYWNSFFPFMSCAIKIHQDFLDTNAARFAAAPSSNQTRYPAQVRGDRIEVKVNGQFQPMTIKGVNLGMATPGHFPGEAAITEEEYRTWFEEIGAMNANTLRVYTLQPPQFYRALSTYNATHDNKLYVLHGVWINEDWITDNADAFQPDAVASFQQEVHHIVDALHGNAVIEHQPGHASGVYAADVSDYVIGWILGTEWSPFMVQGTNAKHQDIGQFEGKYYSTQAASPFEYWLASQMDYTTAYEIDNYNAVRPMSFTNWVTTDLLRHPSDNSHQEDIVEVNPNHIATKAIMSEVGQFASYHVYPYYPDFLQRDQKYVNATDWRGEKNPYYAYLLELRAAHKMPVLVAEFGIPSSRGRTHNGPNGMHQGGVNEVDQGKDIQYMYEDILHANYMGGLIFSWKDEWFKRTWNTMDFDNPDRRPFWSNAQTSEQQFGLLSLDTLKIKVDGDTGDWTTLPLYESDGPIQRAFVDHDERYLYLRLDFKDPRTPNQTPEVLIDTVPNQGSVEGADFKVSLAQDNAKVLVDPYYDIHNYLYSYVYGFRDGYDPSLVGKGSGEFVQIRYALNQEMFNPETGKTTPFEDYETGALTEGNGNPDSPDYNSLADYAWSSDKKSVEVRIPWLLINFRDPSKKEVVADIVANKSFSIGQFISDIGLRFDLVDGGKTIQSSGDFKRFTWDNWDMPESTPRLKKSYDIIRDYFATVK